MTVDHQGREIILGNESAAVAECFCEQPSSKNLKTDQSRKIAGLSVVHTPSNQATYSVTVIFLREILRPRLLCEDQMWQRMIVCLKCLKAISLSLFLVCCRLQTFMQINLMQRTDLGAPY